MVDLFNFTLTLLSIFLFSSAQWQFFCKHSGLCHFITSNLLVFYLSIICCWQTVLLKPTEKIQLTPRALIPLYSPHVNGFVDLNITSSEQGMTEHGGQNRK